MDIVQGANGIYKPFIISKGVVESFEGATVKVSLKRGGELIPKIAEIVNETTGECQFRLYSSDLTITGTYQYQWFVEYDDGRVIPGKSNDFYVAEKLVGVPPISSGDPGIITVKVDGGEF
jgi:hypothetical protein